jgi:NADH-quinone oxidoreductase subunit K
LSFKYALSFSFSLFFFGLIGIIINKQNLLISLMFAEIMLLGVSSGFIVFSIFCYEPRAQVYALIIIVLAACESVIGLSLLINSYRYLGTINFKIFRGLSG